MSILSEYLSFAGFASSRLREKLLACPRILPGLCKAAGRMRMSLAKSRSREAGRGDFFSGFGGDATVFDGEFFQDGLVFFLPVEVGGGDEFLSLLGEAVHEGAAAVGIEFSENVIDEIDRTGFLALEKELALAEFEGESEGSLLAFAAEIAGPGLADFQDEVVAMRAGEGDAATGFAVGDFGEGFFEIALALVAVGEGNFLGAGADFGVVIGDEGGEGFAEFGAPGGQFGSVLDEEAGVGPNLGGGGGAIFQELVPGAEGATVTGPVPEVGGIDLASGEVEVAATLISAAANKAEVVVSDPDHEAAFGEIIRTGAEGFAVDAEGKLGFFGSDFQEAVLVLTGDPEARGSFFQEVGKAAGARRLEAEEEADRFEKGCFSLGVATDEDGAFFGQVQGDLVEAAEIHQAQAADHGGRVIAG